MSCFHRRVWLTSALLLLGACAAVAHPPLRFDPAVEARLDELLRERIAAQRLPGIVVLISVPGQGEYLRAFGEADLRTHAPRRLDDPFRIASITKTFTATVVLQLTDDGKLALSDPVSTWYPDFPNGDRITIDHLLRMRSGIPDSLGENFLAEYYADPLMRLTPDQAIARSAARKAEFIAPDTVTRYTNVNFVLLEQIAVKVSRQPIGAQLDHRIFKLLGLTGTSYPTDSTLGGTTRGYSWNPQSGVFDDKTVLDPTPAGGAGAMISTLADLKPYARALCTGTLLKPETQRLRLKATTLEGEPAFVQYGAGIARIGRFCGHNGTIFGFSSELFYLPEKDAVIVIDVNRLDLDDKSQSTESFLSITKLLFPEYVNW
jgi:D-alanyl-D-alanine carboxypeptidase